MKKFRHIVQFSEEKKRIEIIRLFEDQREEFMTHVDVSDISFSDNKDEFENICKLLGENLVIDSPLGRLLFGIE